MNKLKIYFNKFNLDMVFSAIAAILTIFIFRIRLEVHIYRFLMMFSPVVPDIFIPDHYPDAICMIIGAAGGLSVYAAWNKRGIHAVKKLLVAVFIGMALISAVFFVQVSYISRQLKMPIGDLKNDSIYLPTKIEISSEERMTVGNEHSGTGHRRSLEFKEGSSELESIYYGIQSLSNAVSNDSPFNANYTTCIIYKNNKIYKSRWLRTDDEYAYERLSSKGGTIGSIRYDAEILCTMAHEFMRECRDFEQYKKEDFSAEWFNEMSSSGDANFTDIIDTKLLLAAMSDRQSYIPGNDEKEYYGEFFKGRTITSEDENLIAISYSLKTEEYDYKDVMLYDRAEKLLIFKDKENNMKFVQQDLDSLFM